EEKHAFLARTTITCATCGCCVLVSAATKSTPASPAPTSRAAAAVTDIRARSPYRGLCRFIAWRSLAALLQLAQHAEAVGGEPPVGIIPETGWRTQVRGLAVVRAATQPPQAALSRRPGRAVGRSAAVIVVPAILHPFRRVAGGVEQAERIGLVRAGRKRSV